MAENGETGEALARGQAGRDEGEGREDGPELRAKQKEINLIKNDILLNIFI